MRRLRAGIIGAGAWSAATHLPELARHREVEIEAVSGLSADTNKRIAGLFDVGGTTTDWREVVDRGLDLIIVSSPPVAHEEQVIEALSSGAHVLCEKPMALTSQSAAAMVATASMADRELLVGFGWPSCEVFSQLKTLLDEDAIGSLEHIELRLHANIRDLLTGSAELDWQVGGIRSEKETYQSASISGGGAVTTTLSHGLGLLMWLGATRFRDVFARATVAASGMDLHLAISAELESGCLASISCVSTSAAAPDVEWQIAVIGSTGEIRAAWPNPSLIITGAETTTLTFSGDEAENRPWAPTRSLIEVALGQPAPLGCSGLMGAQTVAVTEAIMQSVTSGASARVDYSQLRPPAPRPAKDLP